MGLLIKIKNKVLNSKVIDLNNDGKVESLKDEVLGLFSQFAFIKDNLDKVNTQLDDLISEEELAKEVELDRLKTIKASVEKRLAESDEVIKKAKLQKDSNDKLKDKVSEFIA